MSMLCTRMQTHSIQSGFRRIYLACIGKTAPSSVCGAQSEYLAAHTLGVLQGCVNVCRVGRPPGKHGWR